MIPMTVIRIIVGYFRLGGHQIFGRGVWGRGVGLLIVDFEQRMFLIEFII